MFAVQFEVEKLMEVRNGLLFTKQQNWKLETGKRSIQSIHTLYKKKRSCRRPSCFSRFFTVVFINQHNSHSHFILYFLAQNTEFENLNT